MVTVQDILALNSKNLELITGDQSIRASQASTPESPLPYSLVFVSRTQDFEAILKSSVQIIICLKRALPQKWQPTSQKQAVFSATNISLAMSELLRFFDKKLAEWPSGIHNTAIIHPTVQIGQGVNIGAYSIIEEGTVLSNYVQIDHHVVIKRNVTIGESSLIHSHVYIGSDSILGKRVEIQPHATIASDGYGYSKTPSGENQKIAQIGKVVLADDVVIGASSCVDRATINETRIGKGTKLDNLCHIAHNVKLGQQGFFTAGFMTAGSIEVGDNFACGGQVGVADHIQITNNVTLAGRTAVTRNITEPGAYIGYPVEPMSQGMKTLATLPKIAEMRKDISELKKKLALSPGDSI